MKYAILLLVLSSQLFAATIDQLFTPFYELKDPRLIEQSKSIAAMVNINKIVPVDANDQDFTLLANLIKKDSRKNIRKYNRVLKKKKNVVMVAKSAQDVKYCKDDFPFQKKAFLSNCTGSLVGPDLILTAGHCVRIKSFCKQYKWVFDYKEQAQGQLALNSDNVYSCKKVIRSKNPLSIGIPIVDVIIAIFGHDVALVRLDKKVNNRTPLKIDFKFLPEVGDEVYTISHPLGMPQVHSKGVVQEDLPGKVLTMTTMPAFGGSSGAPVFDQTTGKIVSIVTRGPETMQVDTENKCRKLKREYLYKDPSKPMTAIGSLAKAKKRYKRYEFKGR
jgi:V8-like Glu-specific endopeptidase